MKFYCITFYRTVDKERTKHKYFVYATSKLKAVQRFCSTTGYKDTCIISIYIMKGE